jgi:imidazolonepropionase-like amidohydrolase
MLPGHTLNSPARLTAPLLALLLAACSPSEPPTPAASAAPDQPPAPATQVAATPGATVTVYEGARLITGDGTTLENGSFIVEGGRFTAVGTAGQVAVPDSAVRVDLRGATVMPAIVDTHVHLSREREPLIEDLQSRARFGVSAALSLGQDTGELPFSIRDEELPGAALYRIAGRGLTGPEPGRSEIPHWVTSEEEARAAVREEAALDVDIIKLWVDDRNGQFEKLTPAIFGAAIDEAHSNGLRVTAHLFTLADAKELLRAGVDAFAHGVRDTDVDDEFIALVKERSDFVLVPNLPGRGVATDMSWLRGSIPDAQFQQVQQQAANVQPAAQEAFAIQARNLARMHAEGVRIALGTDGNTPWGPHLEMEDMVIAGMSPADVITAATRNGAEFLELADMGTIEAGKRADFIVLDANPLDDITNTRRIRNVYLRGAEVERGE